MTLPFRRFLPLPPFRALLLATVLITPVLTAAVIGTNVPALPLTAERIAALPADQRPAWQAYLDRSEKLGAADRAFYAAELKAARLKAPLSSPTKGRALPPAQPPQPEAWWSSPEAARIANIVVSFQTPAGGWNKNTDQTLALRRPGERTGYEAGYVGTIDNDGTVSQLAFLARALTANPSAPLAEAWRTSFERGINYLITAQYPNGGWPQVFPLEGGYHDAITFNDGAIVNVIALLRKVAAGKDEFAFVPAALRERAAASARRGLECILASQVVTNGRLTAWCQQHDMLTLAPVGARNYEPPSISSGESAGIVLFLMPLPNPDARIVASVHAAAAWFQKTAIRDIIFKPSPDGNGRAIIPTPGAGPIWPRYSEIGTDRPIFGDRDLTIHDDVSEISKERRNGYAWFGDNPKRTLDHYAKWAKAHPAR